MSHKGDDVIGKLVKFGVGLLIMLYKHGSFLVAGLALVATDFIFGVVAGTNVLTGLHTHFDGILAPLNFLTTPQMLGLEVSLAVSGAGMLAWRQFLGEESAASKTVAMRYLWPLVAALMMVFDMIMDSNGALYALGVQGGHILPPKGLNPIQEGFWAAIVCVSFFAELLMEFFLLHTAGAIGGQIGKLFGMARDGASVGDIASSAQAFERPGRRRMRLRPVATATTAA